MAKFSEKFFCPAPWTHMYYQTNSPSPCHLIRNTQLNMTPEEYVNSDWLRKIKEDMLGDGVPSPCMTCKKKEDLGLKSTRGAIWGWQNVGPEPEYEAMWFANAFEVDTPTFPRRIEFRFSNLCNMKCRMCDETSSSEWALEKQKFNLPYDPGNNPGGLTKYNDNHIIKITEDKIAGLKDLNLLQHLRHVCFTGGEPFVIKEYNDYLDFLIENNLNRKVKIELFTNCSVYNPLMIERLRKFPFVEFIMSIDGVGKTAEYIRHGTDWNVVGNNVLKFSSLPLPFQPFINVSTSIYTLLDVANLAKFMMSVYEVNKEVSFKGYTVLNPGLHFRYAPEHLKKIIIDQIDEACEILNVVNFSVYKNELKNIKEKLLTTPSNDSQVFYDHTNLFDKIRNESFEETFGIPLYGN